LIAPTDAMIAPAGANRIAPTEGVRNFVCGA
jgi:hypothetical protein